MITLDNINIIRSNRKSISIEVKKDLSIIVRVPYFMRNKDIEKFIDSKKEWIKKHLQLAQERSAEQNAENKFTNEEIKELVQKAIDYIPQRIEYYSRIIGVDYGRITIRNQVSRWGSCSAKGNLNFNCLLMLTPPTVIDYVVVHELCHIKELNHSKKFWDEVEKILPDFREQKTWLKENGNRLIDRLK